MSSQPDLNPWYADGLDAGESAARAHHGNTVPPAPLGLNLADSAAWRAGWCDGWSDTYWEEIAETVEP
jgi:hypothetical protein